jgi:hypothetical protein
MGGRQDDIGSDVPFEGTEEEHAAAAKIQATHRGNKGRKKAKGHKDKKDKEDKRKKENPKIGDNPPKKDKALKGAKGAVVNNVNEAGTKVAEQGVEVMLKMFGKDGGAYLRDSSQRNCRDVPMCISLAIYWGCMLWLLQYAQQNGDIERLFYPVTFEGTACGVKPSDPMKPDLTDYKRLYYPIPTLPEINFCVHECPGNGFAAFNEPDTVPFDQWICHHDIEVNGRYAPGSSLDGGYTDETCGGVVETMGWIGNQAGTVDPTPAWPKPASQRGATCNWLAASCGGGRSHMCDLGPTICAPSAFCAPLIHMPAHPPEGAGQCYHPYGKTQDILYQCIPTQLGENATQLAKEMSGDMGSQHFNDLAEFGHVILWAFGIALFLSFGWILFLDYFAGPLIWFTVYATLIILPTIGAILMYKAGAVTPPSSMEIPPEMQAKMAEVAVDPEIAQNAAYCCFLLTVILAIVFTIFHDRITMSIGVIEEASDCFLAIPKCIALPIVTFILEIPIVGYGVVSTLYLLSMREYDPDLDTYVYNETLQRMIAFSLFGCLWTGYIITSVQYTAIAGACADWYFTFSDKDGDRDIKAFAVERSLYRVLRFNFGTMIFGSLLIAVVAVMKWIATYCIQQVMAQSPENKVVQLLGACLICVVNCVEKLIRFLGKLAYIECAIYGVNFCTGIYSASKRLIKNMVRFSFLSVFAHITIFLGKCLVVAGTVLICETMMTENREASLNPPYAPLVLCGLAAALTVMLVMSVYETAIDTIMMCFLEDEDENTGDKPSFATGELAQFMTSTKAIADAAEAYSDETRQAKTNKIRADDAAQEDLKSQHSGIEAARKGAKGGGRSAKKRKKAKGGGGGGGGDSTEGKKMINPMAEDD